MHILVEQRLNHHLLLSQLLLNILDVNEMISLLRGYNFIDLILFSMCFILCNPYWIILQEIAVIIAPGNRYFGIESFEKFVVKYFKRLSPIGLEIHVSDKFPLLFLFFILYK